MPLHLPTLLTRTGSAVVFGALMLTGLLWTTTAFCALVLVIHVLCLHEYLRLVDKIEGAAPPFGFALLTRAVPTLFLMGTVLGWFRSGSPLQLLLVVYPVSILLASGLSTRLTLSRGTAAVAGAAYITLPLGLLLALRAEMWWLPLALILMIWANDTLAYLVGSVLGKTPFSPISPKKTWEGTAGGALLTLTGAAIAGFLIDGASVVLYLGLAVCATVFGTMGGLFESKLKRLAGVKDSGAIMPGHGGALDRFDSLLVATPFAWCWVYLAHQFL